MAESRRLKGFARQKQNRMSLEFPLFTWERTTDPVKLNTIFTEKEWKLDSPVCRLTESRQDWIHWFECDPTEETYVEIFFKRFHIRVALVWVRLRVNQRLFVLREDFFTDNSTGHVYSAGGVRLECTSPMRGWRLALNLTMIEPATNNKVHVRLGAHVAMTGHTFELPKQVQPSFLARRYHMEKRLTIAEDEIAKCCSECQAILQPNSAFAEIIVDGQRQEFMLFGSRMKCFGNTKLLEDVQIHVGYAENGTTFAAIRAGGKAYGYCSNPTKYVQPIRKTRWHPAQTLQIASNPELSLIFEAGGIHHEVRFGASRSAVDNVGGAGSLLVKGLSLKMQSTCFHLSEFPSLFLSDQKVELVEMLRFPPHREQYLVLSTSEAACKDSKLTGGKASSLAVLADISKRFKTFRVPSAVVLTVNAYDIFAKTPAVSAALEVFLQSSKSTDTAALKAASDECVTAIAKTALPEPILELVKEKLEEVFGPDWSSKNFAVRSSAVGEDSEEMSAAGQMVTFLGMRGELGISTSVVKCWASQYALTAVNYRRQYGQDFNTLMAVVVQEMVSAETAGVMFTCDPVTSDPASIFVTANFGLGESVVSAAVDPDTFALRRAGPEIELITKSRGSKHCMVVELESGNGTVERIISKETASVFCLSDECVIRIASIGASLTDVADRPRDIEWALHRGEIYVLQSRPVTSFFRESDYEIRHDYNTGFYTNREILSRGNFDEVMPGVFSTLGVSITGRLLFEAMNKTRLELGGTDPSQFVAIRTSICGKKFFINLSQLGDLLKKKSILKSTGVTTFGYDVSEHEAIKNGIAHDPSASSSWTMVKRLLQSLWRLKKVVGEVRERANSFTIDTPENGDALAQFTSILGQIPKLDCVMEALMMASVPSALYSMLVLNLLKKSQHMEDFSPELMILLSKLLRSDLEVESAHIPEEFMELSDMLRKDSREGSFVEMSPEVALKWLEEDAGEAAELFRTVRSKHAHRCYKELDVHAKTWDIDPIPLVRLLQSIVRCPKRTSHMEAEQCMNVDQLPKRPTLLQRKLLNFFIPRAKYAVYAREAVKSAVVKCVHRIRLALRKVGQRLHAEGKLPDPELLFFLNCDEVYRLITTKDPSLLPRAIRRRRMHSVLEQERFPVLFYGFPKPIDSTSMEIDPDAHNFTGTPVSGGIIVGPARVIHDFLTEAHLIRRGEILITRATDTGWTPYFPLLGGVVTEIGGLLSHGAVVAREYGLPAIVGVIGITEYVKTGDIVTLDGNEGILHRSAAPGTEHAGAIAQTEQALVGETAALVEAGETRMTTRNVTASRAATR